MQQRQLSISKSLTNGSRGLKEIDPCDDEFILAIKGGTNDKKTKLLGVQTVQLWTGW